jgi:hypothetical protein
MNTKDYNSNKPKELARFYTNIGRMLNSGMPVCIKEARKMLSYDTPNIEACSDNIENSYLPNIMEHEEFHAKWNKFKSKYNYENSK